MNIELTVTFRGKTKKIKSSGSGQYPSQFIIPTDVKGEDIVIDIPVLH